MDNKQIRKNNKINFLFFENISVFFIELICYLYFIYKVPYEIWKTRFFILLLVSIIIQIYTLICFGIKQNSLSIIIILVIYSYHFAHVLLILIDYSFNTSIANLPFKRVGYQEAMDSMGISWLFIYGLYLGMISRNISKKQLKKNIHKYSNIKQYQAGIFITAISIPLIIVIFIISFNAAITTGYGTADTGGILSYIDLFSELIISGLILILTSKVLTPQKAFKFVIIFTFLFILFMLSGKRAFYFTYIAMLFFVYIMIYKPKINFTVAIISIIISFLLIKILNAIRVARSAGISIDSIISALTVASDNNGLLDLLNENGITSNVVATVYKRVNSFHYGSQFFTSFLIMIPGVSTLLPFIDFSQLNVTDSLDILYLGGSFVADAYFDFGYFGIFFTFILGFCLQSFLIDFFECNLYKDYIRQACYAPILVNIILCIRSTLYKLPRLCFYLIIMYIIELILFELMRNGFTLKRRLCHEYSL